MFQLIVAVISIALVAVLAIASIYYGGTAFNQSQMKGQVTALVNAGQQIAGAQALYSNDHGAKAAAIGDLTNLGKYLSSNPAKPSNAAAAASWATDGSVASIALDAATGLTFCNEVQKQAGGAELADAAALTAVTTLPADQQFSCVTSGGNTVFQFRV